MVFHDFIKKMNVYKNKQRHQRNRRILAGNTTTLPHAFDWIRTQTTELTTDPGPIEKKINGQ